MSCDYELSTKHLEFRDLGAAHAALENAKFVKVVSGFLCEEELKGLKKLMLESTDLKYNLGSTTSPVPMDHPLLTRLMQRVAELSDVNPFTVTGGNFFSTTRPYFPHSDTGKDRAEPLYLNLLFPMYQSQGSELKLVLFDQRYVGDAANFFGDLEDPPQPKYNGIVLGTEHYIGPLGDIGSPDYDTLLSHIPKKVLKGLSIEKTLPWRVGDLILFSRTYVHCSANFLLQGCFSKGGMSLFTAKIP